MSNQATFSNQQISNSISDSFDASNIISGIDDSNSELALQAAEVTLEDLDVLQVNEFNVTGSGFEILFNKPIQESTINLYDHEEQKNLFLRDESGDFVNGSIVFKDGLTGFNFVKTGDVLAPGTYNLTLDSVVGSNGEVFDGDKDGQPGGEYTQGFLAVDNEATVLSLADLVLAPGESVGVVEEDQDFSISIDAGTEINQVQLEIAYNPNLLNIKDNFQLTENLPADWQLQPADLSTPGVAKLTLSGSTSLTSGKQNLLSIEANVPKTAEYGTTQTIQLQNVQFNNGSIAGIADIAIHQVAMEGDVSGDGTLSNFDAHLIAQASTGLIDSFAAYPHLDPLIMSDPNKNGDLSAFDAYKTIQRRKELPAIAIDTINSRFILDDGTSIAGTANGKGSQIAEVFYRINDQEVSLISPEVNGAFNLNLETNATENSVFTLQVTAIDNAGKSNSNVIEVVVPTTTSSGLKYVDFEVGDGILPSLGQQITVDYTGFLEDGTVFDSSIARGRPFSFDLGGRVIQGWNEGLANMSVGGSRLLIIPPELGYGERGAGALIPPNATLLFEVELLEIG